MLVCRTPFSNQWPDHVALAVRFAEAGYGVAIQDCRGRYDADGTWRPYRDEGADGHDTIEWLAAQLWCDGNVGGFGSSYDGFAQILMAPHSSHYLKALAPTCELR
jgi:uncharacterized protein